MNLVFQGKTEVQEFLGILEGYGFLSPDRNGLELFHSEEISQPETIPCPGETMDDVGKRDLPFSRRSDAEYLDVSVAFFLLKGDCSLRCFLAPEVIRFFELDLSVVNPKIDGPIRLSLDDALVKSCRFQGGSKMAGHPSKAIDWEVGER